MLLSIPDPESSRPMTSLCLTLAESTRASMERKLQRFAGRVPYIEVRLDYLDDPYVQLPGGTATNFVATCRPTREGGQYRGSEEERVKILEAASRAGFNWVDLEHDLDIPVKVQPHTSVIRSFHSFNEFPEDLEGLLARLERKGGDLMKLAVLVEDLRQLSNLFKWMRTLPPSLRRVIIGMGDYGQLTRMLGCFLGNAWTYVVDAAGETVAPGQFTLQTARDSYHLDSFQRIPSLYGVMGRASLENPGARIHNAWFRHEGLHALALPVVRERTASWIDFASESNLPFKGFAVDMTSGLSPGNRDDAVHPGQFPGPETVALQESAWRARSTFAEGFLLPLKRRFPSLEGLSVLVWGQGELARLAAAALREQGSKVSLVPSDREDLGAADASGVGLDPNGRIEGRFDLVVNASTAETDLKPFWAALQSGRVTYEMVYLAFSVADPAKEGLPPEMTGVQVIPGVERLVETAAIDHETWTGVSPAREIGWSVLAK